MANFKENVKLVFVSYGSKEVGGGNRRGGGRGGFGGAFIAGSLEESRARLLEAVRGAMRQAGIA
ncbi:MAG TPA: hypothetical protein VJ809_00455, partial [Pirellulales bacterium]|nr:hypothetical protein [Pirellulales bacterium]